MKLLFFALLFSSLFAVKSEAQNVPSSINQAFNTAFPFVDKSDWSKAGNLYKAEFALEGKKQFAFFNNGELVAVSRYIEFQSLSDRLRRSWSNNSLITTS